MKLFASNLIAKTILSTALVGAMTVPAFARSQSSGMRAPVTKSAGKMAGHVKVAKAQPGTKAAPEQKLNSKPSKNVKKSRNSAQRKLKTKRNPTAQVKHSAPGRQAGSGKVRHQKRRTKA